MSVPGRLTRLGVVMSADPGADFEAGGVLNPAIGRSPDGRLWLLPRLVAAGNPSRIGIAEVLVRDGQPTGVRRDGVVLAPDTGWERSHDHAGVEDPRTTWIASLGVHVMSYVAFGPLGPRSRSGPDTPPTCSAEHPRCPHTQPARHRPGSRHELRQSTTPIPGHDQHGLDHHRASAGRIRHRAALGRDPQAGHGTEEARRDNGADYA